jgi:ribokinase
MRTQVAAPTPATGRIAVPEPSDAPVVVLGSVNVDLIVEVSELPRPGETVIGNDVKRAPGGKGANQAVGLARLGRQVELVGRIGDDEHGEWMRATLEREGVSTRLLRTTPGVPTGTALISVARDVMGTQENTIVVAPGANARVSVADLDADDVIEALAVAPAVLTQYEVPAETVAALSERVRTGLLILNPAPPPPQRRDITPQLLDRVDVLIPNRTELARLTERNVPIVFSQVVSAARALRDVGYSGDVVVTLGTEGAIVLTRYGDVRPVPSIKVATVDPTGAGDAFCATLVDRLLLGDDIIRATGFAVVAGALATGEVGAQSSLPDRATVEFLHDPF